MVKPLSADIITAVAFLLSVFFALRRQKKSYPPGPKRLPLLGNLLDISREAPYEKFARWSKELDSDIIYLDAAGTPFVVLNSFKAATDLLDKRSSIYSSRFKLTMIYELLEGRLLVAMMPYGDEWRECRQIMSKYLSSPSEIMLARSRDFVRKGLLPNLLDSPEDFFIHIRNGVGGSILAICYGLRIRRVNDPWIALADAGVAVTTDAAVPGKYAVDALPFLKHFPGWMPGTGFQKDAKKGLAMLRRFFSEPFETAKKNIADGTAEPCFMSKYLEEVGRDGEKKYKEEMLENIGGMFFAGGTETSVSAVKTLIAVLLLYPDVQAKAHAEIDRVVGRHRLPDFNDKPNLPYLRALLREVLRWEPVGPMALPHMSTKDDVYRGYYIPKGSIVIGNTWAILHDEACFPNPSKFDPSRFLTSSGELRTDILDPEVMATFGYGRRRVHPDMFQNIPPLNENGEEEAPQVKFLGQGTASFPEPFRCRFTPRPKEVVALIRAEYDETSEYII